MGMLSAILRVVGLDGRRVDRPKADGTYDPVEIVVGSGLTATATATSSGVTRVEISGSGGTVTSVTGTPPIASSGGATPAISIAPADADSPGSMSAAHYNMLDGATAEAAPNELVIRGSNGEVKAGADSDVADDGTFCGPENASFKGRVATGGGTTTRLIGLSGTDLLVGEHHTASRYRSASSHRFEHGASNTHVATLVSGNPAAAREIGMTSAGRPTVYVMSAVAHLMTNLDLYELAPVARFQKVAADGAAADESEFLLASGATLFNRTSCLAVLIPYGSLTANNTDYARIALYRRGGTDDLMGSFTTQTGGGGGLGSWTLNDYLTFTCDAEDLEGGYGLLLKIEKEGSGVVVPPFMIEVFGYPVPV